jgi:hypothetical protein
MALACGVALPGGAVEFRSGETAWSKHHETALLAEPKPLSSAQATVGFAEKLEILERQGAWLRVQGVGGEGWVYHGNVAADKPELPPAASLTTLEASETDSVAAARPLTPAAADYAARHGATDAQADIDWIDAQARQVTPADHNGYMADNRKGEYQE